jgi:hypothetical protein
VQVPWGCSSRARFCCRAILDGYESLLEAMLRACFGMLMIYSQLRKQEYDVPLNFVFVGDGVVVSVLLDG